ncbi:hypothetical protein GCM10007989_19640 [Devosia pacifica]|uniref:N-acyl amino acid synthase FeeM catalytic core domain-containing protein n=1 Tax=Devosia pacifica TaxID=1335967 RepID=A0A918VTJ3_9HYPH|nr:hypothetical protein [Devosia pacifica]GHA24062.1 hypothetical protein GCM10007989_19640 [Devosia pacifica]
MRPTNSSETVAVSRFAGALIDILDRVRYRRVSPDEVFDPVYKLRYEAYRRESFVPINSDAITRDPYDDTPNVYCYGVYIDDRLVSSIRFHHVTPQMPFSPGRSVWPEVLDPVLANGDAYIDPSRFTADFEASLAYPALPYLTLRIVAMACVHFSVRYCLTAVRPEHGAFYRRVFNARQVGEERNFAELTFPMRLFVADVPHIRYSLMERFPFFESTRAEREALFSSDPHTSVEITPSARLVQRLAMAAGH